MSRRQEPRINVDDVELSVVNGTFDSQYAQTLSVDLNESFGDSSNGERRSSGANAMERRFAPVTTPIEQRRRSRAASQSTEGMTLLDIPNGGGLSSSPSKQEQQPAQQPHKPPSADVKSYGNRKDNSSQVEARDLMGDLPSVQLLREEPDYDVLSKIKRQSTRRNLQVEAVYGEAKELARLRTQPSLRDLNSYKTLQKEGNVRSIGLGDAKYDEAKQEFLRQKKSAPKKEKSGIVKLFESIGFALRRKKKRARDPIPFFRSDLKAIEAHLGTPVAAFFVLLRWVFLLDIVLATVWMSLAFLPQVISGANTTHPSIGGLDIFTGQGYFTNTPMFYLGYSPELDFDYNMPVAYIMAIGLCFGISFLVIMYSLASKYSQRNASDSIVLKDNLFPYGVAAFASWDHSIATQPGKQILRKAVTKRFAMLRMESESKPVIRIGWDKCELYMRRILINLLTLVLLGGAGVAIFFLLDWQADHPDSQGVTIVSSLVISSINFALPFLFAFMAQFEWWPNENMVVKVSIIRSFIVRIGSIIVIVISIWRTHREKNDCWLNYLGQQFYRQTLADIVINTGTTLVGEPLYVWLWLKRRGMGDRRDFNMQNNILDLTYRQSLIWLGSTFCPLLPILGALSCVLTFYVKKVIYLRFAKQPDRYFGASRSSNFFLLVMLCALLAVFAPIGYILVRETNTCGPHQNFSSIWGTIPAWIDGAPSALHAITQYLFTVAFLIPLCFFLMGYLYYAVKTTRHQKKRLDELELQLALETADKRFLLQYYRVQT
eukprot:Opistho-2@15644